MPDVDLLVAGAGPVGLAVAIEARRAGMSVAVVDHRDPGEGLDKACGEGLMPSARAALERLGVVVAGREFAGIRYVATGSGRVAEARFSRGPGLGVRRTVLSAALKARAASGGVELRRGRVGDVQVSGCGVRAGGVTARWLAAADGLHSPVRRALGLDPRITAGPHRYGMRRHFRVRPWTDLVEVHWAADCEAYVTPVGDDVVGVAVLGPGGAPFETWLDRFPVLRRRLDGAEPASAVLGAGPLRQHVRRRVHGPVLLAGDAAGYVDALTGEGIAVGLACAHELVGCLARGRPEEYEARWRAATRRYRWLTGGLLGAASRPALRRRIVPAAATAPWAFRAVVDRLG